MHSCVITLRVHSCLKHLEEHDSEHSASCGHLKPPPEVMVPRGVPQSRSPAGVCSDRREAEQHHRIWSLCNTLTGKNAMAAMAGLHIAVILLVFLSPEPMERAQIPLSHQTAAACNERKGLKCFMWTGVTSLLVPCYQISPCWLKVLLLLQDSLGCS